jgi:glycosyltransferase involved in cell wall biosynthesis
MPKLPEANLTLVGDGPQAADLARLVEELELHDRVLFVAPVPRDQLLRIFSLHDLLVMPSITDISPNSALEARSTGLPVLLSKETGLSEKLTAGMVLKDLSNAERIAAAVLEIEKNYGKIAALSAMPGMQRGWDAIASDHLRLFENLLNHA